MFFLQPYKLASCGQQHDLYSTFEKHIRFYTDFSGSGNDSADNKCTLLCRMYLYGQRTNYRCRGLVFVGDMLCVCLSYQNLIDWLQKQRRMTLEFDSNFTVTFRGDDLQHAVDLGYVFSQKYCTNDNFTSCTVMESMFELHSVLRT